MSRVYVYPYSMNSQSGKALAMALGVKRIYPDGKYKPKPNDTVINWGSSTVPEWMEAFEMVDGKFINYPSLVGDAIDKVKCFGMLKGVARIPEYTTHRGEALKWNQDGKVIVVRRKVKGHSGDGMFIIDEPLGPGDEIPGAPLYTVYRKKSTEWRVHVINGTVVDVSMKRLRYNKGNNKPDYKIRNFSSGWIYARQGIEPPQDVLSQALLAVKALGLDMGCVDIGYNKHYDEATVYEVNSAPGLIGTTLYQYATQLGLITGRKVTIPNPGVVDDNMANFPYEDDLPEGKEPPEPKIVAEDFWADFGKKMKIQNNPFAPNF